MDKLKQSLINEIEETFTMFYETSVYEREEDKNTLLVVIGNSHFIIELMDKKTLKIASNTHSKPLLAMTLYQLLQKVVPFVELAPDFEITKDNEIINKTYIPEVDQKKYH